MQNLSREELIGRFPFLRTTPELADEILAQGVRQSFPPESNLYWEGDLCSHIVLVLEGEIRVFKTGASGREITLYEIGLGDICMLNASCVLSNTRYPANAVSRSRLDVLLLPGEVFQRMVAAHQELQRFVFALLSQRFTEMMTLLEEVVFNRVEERLTEYLIEKAENNRLAATHQIIANDLGTSREVVSRLLKEMERQGRVRLGRNVIELHDLV